MEISATVKREITRNIHKRGMTVRGWARVHGFAPASVFQIIYDNYTYKNGPTAQAIIKCLKEEGLMQENGHGT